MEIAELQWNWELFGKTDPLWAILTDPKARNGRWDEEEFFRTGQATVDFVFQELAALDAVPATGSALDFGCGVGRLTQPLAERFESVVGIDIAPAMIALAKRYNRFGERCSYVVNDRPDLSLFPDAKFDFVLTLIVLQHMELSYSRRYLTEMLRVTKPGGIVLFQVPSTVRTFQGLPLPESAFRAAIEPVHPFPEMKAGRRYPLAIRVSNASSSQWLPRPGSSMMPLNLGNHWLDASGKLLALDDGRASIGGAVAPGESVMVELFVTTPAKAGSYVLELDLVQESVSWFASRGSPTFRAPLDVRATDPESSPTPSEALPQPIMEMHCFPRPDVERLVSELGGDLIAAREHESCGPGYESYFYYVRKLRPEESARRSPHDAAAANKNAVRALFSHLVGWTRVIRR